LKVNGSSTHTPTGFPLDVAGVKTQRLAASIAEEANGSEPWTTLAKQTLPERSTNTCKVTRITSFGFAPGGGWGCGV
jgi:hypothetical protein